MEVTSPQLSNVVNLQSLSPMGLGDPDDQSLRKVERDILIPKMMKEEVKTLCGLQTEAFSECCKKFGLMMPFKCRSHRDDLYQCSIKWYQDEEYVKRTTERYLQERSQYRRTGVPSKIFKRR